MTVSHHDHTTTMTTVYFKHTARPQFIETLTGLSFSSVSRLLHVVAYIEDLIEFC